MNSPGRRWIMGNTAFPSWFPSPGYFIVSEQIFFPYCTSKLEYESKNKGYEIVFCFPFLFAIASFLLSVFIFLFLVVIFRFSYSVFCALSCFLFFLCSVFHFLFPGIFLLTGHPDWANYFSIVSVPQCEILIFDPLMGIFKFWGLNGRVKTVAKLKKKKKHFYILESH